MWRYRRQNTVKIWFTVYRQKLTVMLRYRRKNTAKIAVTVYRQNLPSKNEKPSTAKNLPSCCVTAVKIPSKFDLPSTTKNVTVKKGKTVYRQKVTVMLGYRPVQVRKKYRYRTPPWFFSQNLSLKFLIIRFSTSVAYCCIFQLLVLLPRMTSVQGTRYAAVTCYIHRATTLWSAVAYEPEIDILLGIY